MREFKGMLVGKQRDIVMQYNPDINGTIIYTTWMHKISAYVMKGEKDVVGIWKPKS